MMSRRDTTLRAMAARCQDSGCALPEWGEGESFRDYYVRAAAHWLDLHPEEDPALTGRVEVILRRDARRRGG